ncbi:MAG: argininosuccinate lyase [Candidatus Thorarchaeota archaeon]
MKIAPEILERIHKPHLEDDLKKYTKYLIWANHAHLLMLKTIGIISSDKSKDLLSFSANFDQLDFIKYIDISRKDLYFNFEQYFIMNLGDEGEKIHTGRSRNDLFATILRMYLREKFLEIEVKNCDFLDLVLKLADKYSKNIMTGYTHLQPAQPITLGYYLEGFAYSLIKELDESRTTYKRLNRCPLGSGAFSGSTIPLNIEMVSSLLGFDEPSLHHLESITNQDHILKLLGLWSIQCLTISRFAHDLYIWCTNEFNYMKLNRNISGISSMMPQKQNPFLLEIIKGKTGSIIGTYNSAILTMKNTPFCNCIDAKTESIRFLEIALSEIESIYILLHLVLTNSEFNTQKMEIDAKNNFCTMTDLTEALVVEYGFNFRNAHKFVTELVHYIQDNNLQINNIKFSDLSKFFLNFNKLDSKKIWSIIDKILDPTFGVMMRKSNGGPNLKSFRWRLKNHKKNVKEHRVWINNELKRLKIVQKTTMKRLE